MAGNQSRTTLDAIKFNIMYTLATSFVGYPAELMKTQLQSKLETPCYSVLKQCVNKPLSSFYTGFTPCLLRQYSKTFYRPILITQLPRAVEDSQIPVKLQPLVKAGLAGIIDVSVGAVFENLKTTQIKHSGSHKRMSPLAAGRHIFKHKGYCGFFRGSPAMMYKSFPSWLNLFVAYQLIESKREKKDFLHTLFWGTATATPLTFCTTPFDTIKTQQQIFDSAQSMKSTASHIYNNYGLSRFWRGLFPRIGHKSLAMTGGIFMLDINERFRHKTSNSPH